MIFVVNQLLCFKFTMRKNDEHVGRKRNCGRIETIQLILMRMLQFTEL